MPDPFRLEYGSIRKALHAIPETHNENWKEIEANIRCVINEKLHLGSSQMVIEHAHGTGNPSGYAGKRPMPIVILFFYVDPRKTSSSYAHPRLKHMLMFK